MSIESYSQNGSTQYENYLDRWYREYVTDILENGKRSNDRTETGTTKTFGHQARFDLKKGFPLLTTKFVWFEGIVRELLWFLRGQTNIRPLLEQGVSIWTGNAYAHYQEESSNPHLTQFEFEEKIREHDGFAERWGELGPIYGKQWRSCEGLTERETRVDKTLAELRGNHREKKRAEVDQISRLIEGLKESPDSRRHVVSAWNPTQINDTSIPPCHYGFQCYTEKMTVQERQRWAQSQGFNVQSLAIPETVSTDNQDWHWKFDELGIPRRSLSLMWNQRSVDSFLGLPFNIASYALLTHLLARHAGMAANEVIFSGGDCHIYDNHRDQIKEQIERVGTTYLPTLSLPEGTADDLGDYQAEEFGVEDYDPAPSIEGEMAA
jgi:thymidylate synthase